MCHRLLIIISIVLLCFCSISEAADKYHFGWDKDLEVTIKPEFPEYPAGSEIIFTATLKNKSRNTVKIHYPTGQQWDLIVYDTKRQIFRWSNGYMWYESPHYISLKPGEERSQKMSWVTVNKNGKPLLQGVYKCVGMVTSSPTKYISDKVSFRLTPPTVTAKEIIKTSLNQCFEIEVPRYYKNQELAWDIVYKHNDNRIEDRFRRVNPQNLQISFKPKRLGHVEFDLYGYVANTNRKLSVERRSYRVEVE